MTPVATPHATRAEAERRIAAARHVAEVRHAVPGEALITCTCGKLRTAVDVDDRQALTLVLSQHLRTNAAGEDHLLVDDTRTGILYAVTPDAEPEILLIIHRAVPLP
jgi:hypothetical protein